jgi:protein Tob/BTG
MTATSSLCTTLTQAIAYLTQPLTVTHPAATINRLQSALEANLTALFAPTWTPNEPFRGSDQRCLTLSPTSLPPRAIYTACLASNVQWFDWIAALGGREFDFHVDPGRISVQFGRGTKLITIWSEGPIAEAVPIAHHTSFSQLPPNNSRSKTLAQQLWENDRTEDEELFALIADEISAPSWMTPIVDRFPAPARSESPLSTVSSVSCSSYCSSDLCSCFSLTAASTLSSSQKSNKQSSRLTRREKARQACVFVDTSKTEVIPYDGGKTTVLTGGVMLGAAPPKGKSGTSTLLGTTHKQLCLP